MTSFREYATQRNISYEAVRKQIRLYEDELSPHIIKQGRTRYLDDDGIRILDSHRAVALPAVVSEKQENEDLKKRIAALENQIKADRMRYQEELLKAKDEVVKAQEEAILYLQQLTEMKQIQQQEPAHEPEQEPEKKLTLWQRTFGRREQ